MNLSGKPHIQDIDIIIYKMYLFLQRRVLIVLAHIVPEKSRHIFQKFSGSSGIFHHSQLRSRVQRIKKKMRIDLRLEIFQLSVF